PQRQDLRIMKRIAAHDGEPLHEAVADRIGGFEQELHPKPLCQVLRNAGGAVRRTGAVERGARSIGPEAEHSGTWRNNQKALFSRDWRGFWAVGDVPQRSALRSNFPAHGFRLGHRGSVGLVSCEARYTGALY